jgi:hypothetical protein
MGVDQFREAVEALADFSTESAPDAHGRHKVVGMIGGEPPHHPEFAALCKIFRETVPDRSRRGLWTGLHLGGHPLEALCSATFGYFNVNTHGGSSWHQPVLVASGEIARSDEELWRWIDACWVQSVWSSSITPKGFFPCEVMGALDLLFSGPGGIHVSPACWQHDLAFYRYLFELWCPRCGACVPGLPRRQDCEAIDDISPRNLEALARKGSVRVQQGRYSVFRPEDYHPEAAADQPAPYLYRDPPK